MPNSGKGGKKQKLKLLKREKALKNVTKSEKNYIR